MFFTGTLFSESPSLDIKYYLYYLYDLYDLGGNRSYRSDTSYRTDTREYPDPLFNFSGRGYESLSWV